MFCVTCNFLKRRHHTFYLALYGSEKASMSLASYYDLMLIFIVSRALRSTLHLLGNREFISAHITRFNKVLMRQMDRIT